MKWGFMSNVSSSNQSRVATSWVALIISLGLVAVSVYDFASGQVGVATWTGIICWPIVSIASIIQIVRAKK